MAWTRMESDGSSTAVGVFRDAGQARRAMAALRERGFRAEQIDAAFRDADTQRENLPERSPAQDSSSWFGHLRDIYQDNTGHAAVKSNTGATNFESALVELHISAADAYKIARETDPGGAVVTVAAGSRTEEAQGLLDEYSTDFLSNDVGAMSTTYEKPVENLPAVRSEPVTPQMPAAPGHIQLFGEVLNVQKEKISSGDVRVRKETVTDIETIRVPVTREQLVVEHTDGRGQVDPAQGIRIPLSEERVLVNKETVLKEEYKVGKRDVTEDQEVGGNIRREKLVIGSAETDAANSDGRRQS